MERREHSEVGASVAEALSRRWDERRVGADAVAGTSVGVLTRLIDEVARTDTDRPGSLLVVGIADELGWFASAFAPMSGGITSAGMRAERHAVAGEVAQQAVGAVPRGMTVRHFGCHGWHDRKLPRMLADHSCDRLLIDPAGLTTRQMRRVRDFSDAAGIELVACDGSSDASPSSTRMPRRLGPEHDQRLAPGHRPAAPQQVDHAR